MRAASRRGKNAGIAMAENFWLASEDADFVAKDPARALQSLFRSSDGYDEELARVQRGEMEDGDDLWDCVVLARFF